jgi:glycosyltransferase involved in cell wall biosynthesis
VLQLKNMQWINLIVMNRLDENLEFFAKNHSPLVSFVLIAYNQESYIRDAVRGVFSQTYSPMELILSDDCSDDNTFVIMKEMAAAYNGPHRVILNRNEKNLGIGPHVDRAVSLSTGEWIVIAGGDDVSVPDRVERSMTVIRKYGELGGVFGRYHEFSGQFEDVGCWMPSHAVDGVVIRGGDKQWLNYSRRGKILGMPGCVAMWNRKLFEHFSPMPFGTVAEDVVLGARALISGLGIAYTSAGLVHYRAHNTNCYNGINRGEFERQIFFSRAVVHRDLLEFRKKHPNLYSNELWGQITYYFETVLFRSVVIIRRAELGRIWSRLLYMIGFQRRY